MERLSTQDALGLLAQHLVALGSPTRLQLLHQLRTPKALHEIRVQPTLTRRGERPDRPLARQSVMNHLEQLVKANLVHRVPDADGGASERYVLNHPQVFAMVDEMRSLARLRAAPSAKRATDRTLDRESAAVPRLPTGPRLLLAYGRDEGVSFALEGVAGARWTIGRGEGCEVRLDYDPYLSTEHCHLERTSGGYVLHDLGSRNGTWLNWERVPARASAPLAAGDLISIGRSILVFQRR